MRCDLCGERGFVQYGEIVAPCPRCNPDSGFEPGEYEAEMIARLAQCSDSSYGAGKFRGCSQLFKSCGFKI